MAVCSITNFDTIMVVEDFLYKPGFVYNEKRERVEKKFLIGVRCSFINGNGERVYERFHSKELIPHSVILNGKNEAYMFYSREGKYKDY